jgi:hypothetical protein
MTSLRSGEIDTNCQVVILSRLLKVPRLGTFVTHGQKFFVVFRKVESACARTVRYATMDVFGSPNYSYAVSKTARTSGDQRNGKIPKAIGSDS